jgi:hypothetical protein
MIYDRDSSKLPHEWENFENFEFTWERENARR